MNANSPVRPSVPAKSEQIITDVSVTIFAWKNVPVLRYSDRNPATTGSSELGLVTIKTGDGLEGHAFLGSSIRGAYLDIVSLIRTLKPKLIGADPCAREKIWTDLHTVQRATTMRTIGAVDVALWDLAGKIAGMPLCRMLGMSRDRIPCYASSPTYATIEEYVREAEGAKKAGYRGYKIHPPRKVEDAVAACKAIRDAVGADFPLMIDTGGIHDFVESVRLGKVVEELGFLWFEDPLAEDDIYNYTKLRQKLTIPLMATEYSPGGFHSYANWIVAQATDYLRGDVAVKGGLTGILKAATLADAFRMNYEIHHGGNSLNNLAQLHAALSIRNTQYFEVLLPAAAQKYALIEDLEIDAEGCLSAPQGPGLGAKIDFDLIEANKIEVLR